MSRPIPGDEPALRPSDLDCEASFFDYCEAHQFVDRDGLKGYLRRDSFESGFVRRQAWLAWREGKSPRDVNEGLRARVREMLADRPDAPPAAAWSFATKVAVAALACVGPEPRVDRPARESAYQRADRRARAIADNASRSLAKKEAA